MFNIYKDYNIIIFKCENQFNKHIYDHAYKPSKNIHEVLVTLRSTIFIKDIRV